MRKRSNVQPVNVDELDGLSGTQDTNPAKTEAESEPDLGEEEVFSEDELDDQVDVLSGTSAIPTSVVPNLLADVPLDVEKVKDRKKGVRAVLPEGNYEALISGFTVKQVKDFMVGEIFFLVNNKPYSKSYFIRSKKQGRWVSEEKDMMNIELMYADLSRLLPDWDIPRLRSLGDPATAQKYLPGIKVNVTSKHRTYEVAGATKKASTVYFNDLV